MDERTEQPTSSGPDRVRKLPDQGQYAQEILIAERLCEQAASTFGEMHSYTAASLNNLAGLYRAISAYDRAEPLYQRALAICERVLGPEHVDTATTLNNLGLLYTNMSAFARAEQLSLRALAIREGVLGTDHPHTATSLNNLATLYAAMGAYDQAEPLFQRVVAICERVLDSEPTYTAASLANLGSLYRVVGAYNRAEPLCQRALTICERTLGPEHPHTATSVHCLALLYSDMGSYSRAEFLFQRALAIRERVLGAAHPRISESLAGLAQVYRFIGAHDRARPLLERALAICERALGAEHPDTAGSLNNLAMVCRSIGAYDRAEQLSLRALAISERVLGSDHSDTATILNNLGLVYCAQGAYARAQSLCERALAVRERSLGAEHQATGVSLNSLAMVHQDMGAHTRAEPFLQRALAIFDRALGAENHRSVLVLQHLSGNSAAQGKYAEALAHFRVSIDMEDSVIREVLTLASERERSDYVALVWGGVFGLLSLVFSHFREMPGGVRLALDYVLRRKALTAEAAGVQQRAILEGRYPHLRHRLEKLNLLRGQIALKIKTGPASKEAPNAHHKTLAIWRAEREALETDLARMIPEIRLERSLAGVDARAVAARIPGNGALVEFVRFNLFNFKAVPAKGDKPWTGERYLAFVLSAEELDSVRLVDLGETMPIDTAIQQFRKELTGEFSDPKGITLLEKASPSVPAVGDRPLSALIFDPLVAALGGCRTLILSPDGELTRLPFEALTLRDGGYLIDHYEIRYVTSGRDLVRIAEAEVLAGTDPLVLADPAFDLGSRPAHATAPKEGLMGVLLGWLGRRTRVPDGEPAPGRRGEEPPATATTEPAAEGAWRNRCSRDLDRGEIRFDPLPGSREEGHHLGLRLGALPMIGEAALEGRLKKQRSPAIVHLATHGFFLENQPRQVPTSAFSDEIGVMDRLAGHENPMLRSGLALAGANTFLRERRSVSDEMEDGLLTAEDVAGMDLLNTELVFLSACETGLGDVQVGEGVFGLRRAFVIAGARTLIMTLWKVSDLATAILVEHFYQHLLDGTPKGKALRQAQHDLRAGKLGKLRQRWLSEPMRERLAAGNANRRQQLDQLAAMPDDFRPFTHPYYWAAFILQGDDGVLNWRPTHATSEGAQ